MSRLPILGMSLLMLVAIFSATTLWAAYSSSYDLRNFTPHIQQLLNIFNQGPEVITPPPLRLPFTRQAGQLTIQGILEETNRHRTEHGLPSLLGNAVLGQAAQKKVDDMFARQYFEHEAPDGTGPADLVDSVQYQYIRVGENLALGNFADDTTLVQAWMDSPGHRANILHTGFSELGIAIGRGTFEGHETWLAVQTFALPLSECPTPDPKLQQQFEQQKSVLESLSTGLDQMNDALNQQKEQLDHLGSEIEKLVAEGNQKIAEGNANIQKGNEVYEETGDKSQAQPYWDQGKQQQAEGQALIEQAKDKQVEYETLSSEFNKAREIYNQKVTQQQQKNSTIQQLTNQLNQQIRGFNACLEK